MENLNSKSNDPQARPIATTLIPDEKFSDFANALSQIADFMQQRQTIRGQMMVAKQHHINNKTKNSLSNYINIKTKTQKKEKTEFQHLMQQLAEKINEGHTVLELPLNDALYIAIKDSDWVTILPAQSGNNDTKNENFAHQRILNQPLETNTPIIIQPIMDTMPVDETNAKTGRVVIWLHRQWFAEHQLANQLLTIANRPVTKLAVQFDKEEQKATKIHQKPQIVPNSRQQLAIENACKNALSIITGGPGTGKTFTVAQLVIALQHTHDEQKKLNSYLPPLSIALTAPTGKAAQRMQESLNKSLQGETVTLDNAKTLHRLLGIGTNGMPRYHHDNPLPDDLVIVDEASMLGLELASQLVDAIKPTGRLILLGDANQLAAVDAGAVLADLCNVPALQPYRIELTESQRFDKTSAIGQLALAIGQPAISVQQKKQKIQQVKKIITPPKSLANETAETNETYAIEFIKISSENSATFAQSAQAKPTPNQPSLSYHQIYQALYDPFQPFFDLTKIWLASPPDLHNDKIRAEIFQVFDNYRILAAGHHGKLGTTAINLIISQYHKHRVLHLPPSDSHFYHGQPIMMLKNDYQLGLFNGDIGVCLYLPTQGTETLASPNSSEKQLIACFPDKIVDISRLSHDSYTTAYALSIHKSQGSEFSHVAVCLDVMHTRLLSQELIYTAITRSKKRLDLYSSEMTLNTVILQKGNRQTGLALQF